MSHWTRLPLVTRLPAICQLGRSEGGTGPVGLARRSGTRRPTARPTRHEPMAAMRAREAEKPGLEGRVEVDDAYPGGQRTGGRRGRGAAGETPLLAAVETTAERRPGRLRLIAVEGFHEKGIEKIAGRDLAPAGSVATDGLSCRRAVERAGRTHFPMTTGSGPQAARWIPLTRVGTAPGNIETALAGACRHVSAGHAQRHLASAARRLDRRLQLDSPTERLPTPARPAPLPYGLILAG